jgi:hypothetical protein
VPTLAEPMDGSVNEAEKGKKVSDQQLACLALDRLDFDGEWNYVIHPRGCSCAQ